MHTTTIMDETTGQGSDLPGAQLAALRIAKGLSAEYVAGKLHLRLHIIQLLEADDYKNMPEAVFIKGYIRAYAKLLEVNAEPMLSIFNSNCDSSTERKLDKALWQTRRETHRGEHAVRWLTAVFALGVMVAVAVWWHKNRDNENLFPSNLSQQEPAKAENEIRLTDLSKMRSLLASPPQYSASENENESE